MAHWAHDEPTPTFLPLPVIIYILIGLCMWWLLISIKVKAATPEGRQESALMVMEVEDGRRCWANDWKERDEPDWTGEMENEERQEEMKQRGKGMGGRAAAEQWVHTECSLRSIAPNNGVWLRKIRRIIAVSGDDWRCYVWGVGVVFIDTTFHFAPVSETSSQLFEKAKPTQNSNFKWKFWRNKTNLQ